MGEERERGEIDLRYYFGENYDERRVVGLLYIDIKIFAPRKVLIKKEKEKKKKILGRWRDIRKLVKLIRERQLPIFIFFYPLNDYVD